MLQHLPQEGVSQSAGKWGVCEVVLSRKLGYLPIYIKHVIGKDHLLGSGQILGKISESGKHRSRVIHEYVCKETNELPGKCTRSQPALALSPLKW